MKKILVILFVSLTVISCSSTKIEKNTNDITQTENGVYKLKGKHRDYTNIDKEYLEMIQSHPFMMNAKYDFLKELPRFIDYKVIYGYNNGYSIDFTFYEEYSDSLKIFNKNYIQTEKPFYDPYNSNDLGFMGIKGIFNSIKTHNFSDEEWNDFLDFLSKIKESNYLFKKDISQDIDPSEWLNDAKIREEENKRKSYDNAFRYAASVNENFNIDLGSIPLKAFDEIKFSKLDTGFEDTINGYRRTDWRIIEKYKDGDIDMYFVKSLDGIYMYIGCGIGINLGDEGGYIRYNDKCRLVYIDNGGRYRDGYGNTRKACVFMFAKGWTQGSESQ